MLLTIREICKFADCNVQSRNFVEGEKCLKSKHILKCGKMISSDTAVMNIIGFCMQTSNLKSTPHTIKMVIHENGSIINSECSCKAGLSGKCKHTLAVLLYCTRFDTDDFEVLSCTDLKCTWKEPQKKTLVQYSGTSVEHHAMLISIKTVKIIFQKSKFLAY